MKKTALEEFDKVLAAVIIDEMIKRIGVIDENT